MKKEGETIGKLLKPTNDIIFQLIFGRNKNKHLTDNLIKSTFNYINNTPPLNNMKIQSEVSLERLDFNDKSVRLDIIAEYDEAIICIEMQNKFQTNIYSRARCYFAKVCATQLERGKNYLKLKPLTMIIILNEDTRGAHNPECLENIITVNDKYRDQTINIGIKFIFIFLPRLKNNSSLDYSDPFIQWLKFLEYTDMEVIKDMAEKNTLIKEAKDEVEFISAEEEERRIQRFYDNGFFEVRLAYSEGIDAGRTEGEISGRLNAFIEIAKQMLAKKYTINEIKSLTGLSEKEIQKLAENI